MPEAVVRAGLIAAVFIGGSFGTAARLGLESALPAPHGFPLPTLVVNLSGAFLLGVVLESLLRSREGPGRRRRVQLVVGTGFLGAFTTYSAFALDTVTRASDGHAVIAVVYVAATIIGGVLLSFLGVWVASVNHRDGPTDDDGPLGSR